MNRDGSNDYWVPNTNAQGDDHAPAWAPDGRQIAFVNLLNSEEDIFVITPAGSSRQNLTQHRAQQYGGPVWEP